MKLRRPTDELTGCCWLPRMADKVRASHQGNFPVLYRLALGSPLGIDGHFLRHFGLNFKTFQRAVLETKNDEKLAQWFVHQPGVTQTSIINWNTFAPKIGTPGYPGSIIKHLVKWVLYPKSVNNPRNSLFEMIEQGEEC